MTTDDPASPTDLGFRYRTRKDGDVEVHHHGRFALTLRGRTAADFLARAPNPMHPDAQQLMARVTGNYRRGNERQAANHARHRR